MSNVSRHQVDSSRFSKWKAWQSRHEIEGLHFPGVYALAISRTGLAGKDFAWPREIVYFGMTNAISGLKGRLKQFNNTLSGKFGHGGAERFRYDFPLANELFSQLYVAVCPFKCDVRSGSPTDLFVMGSVVKAEYECLAQFAELFGHLPKYNDKKNAPKLGKCVLTNDG